MNDIEQINETTFQPRMSSKHANKTKGDTCFCTGGYLSQANVGRYIGRNMKEAFAGPLGFTPLLAGGPLDAPEHMPAGATGVLPAQR